MSYAKQWLLAAAAGLSFLSAPVLAQVQVQDAWIRATLPQQKATGAFMKIQAERAVRLVGVGSSTLPVVELHEMRMQDQVMKMRRIDTLDLTAGQTLELKPGSYHLMLMNLDRALQPGERIPLELQFEDAKGTRSRVQVQAEVRAMTPPAAPASQGQNHGHGHGH